MLWFRFRFPSLLRAVSEELGKRHQNSDTDVGVKGDHGGSGNEHGHSKSGTLLQNIAIRNINRTSGYVGGLVSSLPYSSCSSETTGADEMNCCFQSIVCRSFQMGGLIYSLLLEVG